MKTATAHKTLRSARSVRFADAKRLSPVGVWLREAADEVRRDIAEVKAGRPGFLRTYSADELLKELHA